MYVCAYVKRSFQRHSVGRWNWSAGCKHYNKKEQHESRGLKII